MDGVMSFMVKTGLCAGTCQSEHSDRLKKCDLATDHGVCGWGVNIDETHLRRHRR